MMRQLFIALVLFCWTIIAFPQAVSIHPYMFDFSLSLGPAFCLGFWLQRPELDGWLGRPALRLAVLMVVAALLMTNLIDLARVK